MKISVNIDSTVLIRRMRNGEKRMAYAVVNALNNTAKKIQEAERARVLQDFTVRKQEFISRQAAIIKPFASVGKAIPYVEISVGQKSRLLLAQFEYGGQRKPSTPGAKNVAVPVIGAPARPSFATPVPTKFYFTKLAFSLTRPQGEAEAGKRRRRSKKSAAAKIRYGKENTYLVPSVGVFQRTSKGESELLYAFIKNEELPKKLEFVDTAQSVTRQWFDEYLQREISAVLARHAGER